MTQLGKIVAIQTYIYDDPQGKEQECKIQKPFDAWFHITFSDRVWLKERFQYSIFSGRGQTLDKNWQRISGGMGAKR